MDGVHQRIDEVFKVSKDSWTITKGIVGITKKALHRMTDIAEFTVRTTTSVVKAAKSAAKTIGKAICRWFSW